MRLFPVWVWGSSHCVYVLGTTTVRDLRMKEALWKHRWKFLFRTPFPLPAKTQKVFVGYKCVGSHVTRSCRNNHCFSPNFFLSHCLLNSVVKHFSFYFLLVLCTDTFSSNAQHARENDNCLYGTINILVWMYFPRMSFIFVCFPRWCCGKVSSWIKSKVYIANAELCKRRMWICAAFAMHCWATVN